MNRLLALPFLAALILLISGCPNYGYKYDSGRFPGDPVNFSDVNSEYDDYNSTSPVIESDMYLYFSSNRNSNGDEFDVVGSDFHISWDKDKGRLTVNDQPSSWKDYGYADTLFYLMNTGNNEFGPYSLPYYDDYFHDEYDYTDLIVYSNDEQGKQDLKFVWFRGEGSYPSMEEGIYGGPEPLSFMNSEFNDAYATFYGPGFITVMDAHDTYRITEILFCSDRQGDYDIYQVPVTVDSTILQFLLKDTGGPVTPVDVLNSGYQDKCPFVNGELLVFASDRPGGFGGFDLYYSRRNGATWSEPVNFGDRINTSSDEFRPIVSSYWEFENDLMLFSSNRPGGKGGYDLYYVGIQKMME